jgi:hypothetical protein
VASAIRRCAHCGSALAPTAESCPVCDAPVGTAPPPAPPARSADVPMRGEAGRRADRDELERHAGRIRQWAQSAQPLGLTIPELPAWAAELVAAGDDAEAWGEVLRGVERIAQQRVVVGLEAWARDTQARLRRLEAYSVDSRLEREEIEDALHAAKTGEIGRALATYQQVARVVALKERHLDQAREELERLVSLLRDMESLDLLAPDDPDELAQEIERELRKGRLAPLKQRLREIQAEAHEQLAAVIPTLVRRWGDLLLRSRTQGHHVEPEAAVLARAARAYARGRLDESLRELRHLAALRAGANRAGPAEIKGSSQTGERPRPRSDGEERPPPRTQNP